MLRFLPFSPPNIQGDVGSMKYCFVPMIRFSLTHFDRGCGRGHKEYATWNAINYVSYI